MPSYVNQGIDPHGLQVNHTFQSGLPLGATVSDDLKAKIWANEYINFDLLLPEEDNFDSADLPMPLVLKRDNNNKTLLGVQEHSSSKKIKTLDQWTTAFSTFTTIYCQKYSDPQVYGDLMKYMETVRDMARHDGNSPADW